MSKYSTTLQVEDVYNDTEREGMSEVLSQSTQAEEEVEMDQDEIKMVALFGKEDITEQEGQELDRLVGTWCDKYDALYDAIKMQ